MSETIAFSGTYTALVTPMYEDGSIDWMTLTKSTRRQITGGVQGLVPVGTTGESPTVNSVEHLRIIEAVVKEAKGKLPVIAGTGANSTEEALHLTREADHIGADAFLQVAPYYNKPSQEGLFQHFSAIAECTSKPIVLYSIPGRCGIEIAPETVARLAQAYPHVRTIKEAGGDVGRVTLLKEAAPEVTVLCGDDGLTPDFVRAGARGVVSVAANLSPEAIVTFTNACLEGDSDKVEVLAQRWNALLTELVFLDGNPVTIKEALYQADLLPTPRVRLPLVRMSPGHQQRVHDLIQSLNLIFS
jgi:4-hydroxy-tetrahydrodipicolinate synthase